MTTSGEQPVGSVLDNLGVSFELYPGDLVDGVVVLVKIVGEDGTVRLAISSSDGLSWIERQGMLRIAESYECSDE